jgi:hypothetical protein
MRGTRIRVLVIALFVGSTVVTCVSTALMCAVLFIGPPMARAEVQVFDLACDF